MKRSTKLGSAVFAVLSSLAGIAVYTSTAQAAELDDPVVITSHYDVDSSLESGVASVAIQCPSSGMAVGGGYAVGISDEGSRPQPTGASQISTNNLGRVVYNGPGQFFNTSNPIPNEETYPTGWKVVAQEVPSGYSLWGWVHCATEPAA